MRYVITHGHIFKNAGSTFDGALKKAFGKGFIDHRDDIAMRRGGADYLNDLILSNPKLQAISSHHLCNPLPVSNEYKCVPIYFVRHPIERIVSVYNFEKFQPASTPGSIAAKKLNLVEYVRWRFEPAIGKVISNYQTSYIAYGAPSKKVPATKCQALGRIFKLHQDDEIILGSVESFEKSFLTITEKIKSLFPGLTLEYKNKNVANELSFEQKLHNAYEALAPIMGEVILENEHDLALYEYVKSCIN